jgi:hypothetical protein
VTRQTRRSVRDRWYLEVIRTRLVNGACRELLSLLAVRHMTDTGYVCVPRATLAEELDVLPQRVTDRIMQATAAGLLVRVAGGHNGATARYVAALPTPEVSAEPIPTRRAKVLPEPIPTVGVGNGRATPSEPIPTREVGIGRAVPIRARAPSERNATTPTSEGDLRPPPDRDRGTPRPPPAAAAATTQVHGHDETGDYLAGRSRLATEVGQGDHRTRARRMNGRPR